MAQARACAALLAALALLTGIQAASAASTQWYPQAGTTIGYQLSWDFSFKSGARYADTIFNVYNQTVEDAVYLYPKAAEAIFPLSGVSNYNLLAGSAEVTVRHAYAETSLTTLGRHVSVIAGGFTFETGKIRVLLFRNVSWSIMTNVNNTNDAVQKSGFFTAPNQFVDHIDCTKNPGDTFTDTIQPSLSTSVLRIDATVVGRTSERILASSFLNNTTSYYRGGYVAEASGQVISYTYTLSGGTLLTNIAGASCTYSRQVSTTLLPEWAYWIICGVLAVLAIGLAALAIKRGRKKS